MVHVEWFCVYKETVYLHITTHFAAWHPVPHRPVSTLLNVMSETATWPGDYIAFSCGV